MAELVDTMALQSAPPFEPYRRADIRFHIALAEASCSARLVAAMTEVQGQMSELIGLIAHPEEVLGRANDQHRDLVAALARCDGTAAAKIVRTHLVGTEHILAGLMPHSERRLTGKAPCLNVAPQR